MGYFLTSQPENAVPVKSRAMPKTHTPGSRLEKRGLRFYNPGVGRWLSRDPMGEFKIVTSDEHLKQVEHFEAHGFEAIERKLADYARRRVGRVITELNLYQFANGNPVNYVDPFGLRNWPYGGGELCTGKNCKKDKCTAKILPEDWQGKDDPWQDIPDPGKCVEADAVVTPKGGLKIPDNCKCTINCNDDGSGKDISCTCAWAPGNPTPGPMPPEFPPSPYPPPQPNPNPPPSGQ